MFLSLDQHDPVVSKRLADPGRITELVPRCRPAVRTGVRRSCQSGGGGGRLEERAGES